MTASQNLIGTFDADLLDYVKNDHRLYKLVAGRVWRNRAPQKETLPYVVMNIFGRANESHISGKSDLRTAQVQFSVWGSTSAQVNAIVDAIWGLLEAEQDTAGEVDIRTAYLLNSVPSLPEPGAGEEGFSVVGEILDFEIIYNEARLGG